MDIKGITNIEERYCRPGGEPALGEAFANLRARWQAGQRDRETNLRILFLSWYSLSEPTWLTGLPGNEDLRQLFQSAFGHLNETIPDDSEFLFVAGYMAALFPWCCGDEFEWERAGRACLKRFQSTGESLSPEAFSGRGAYGQYFEHIITSGWITDHLEETIVGEQDGAPKRPPA